MYVGITLPLYNLVRALYSVHAQNIWTSSTKTEGKRRIKIGMFTWFFVRRKIHPRVRETWLIQLCKFARTRLSKRYCVIHQRFSKKKKIFQTHDIELQFYCSITNLTDFVQFSINCILRVWQHLHGATCSIRYWTAKTWCNWYLNCSPGQEDSRKWNYEIYPIYISRDGTR